MTEIQVAAAFIREFLITECQGRGNGINCAELAVRARVKPRAVREAVTRLREAGVAVCGRPETGYFIAKTREEVEETCGFLRGRALRSLTLESKLRKIPLPELVGQLQLELGEGRE